MQCTYPNGERMTDQNPQFPTPPAYPPAPPAANQSGLSDNAAGGIAYLTFIPAIIFLIVEPFNRNPFVKFHSWQSILLAGAAIAISILRIFVTVFLHHIPGFWILNAMVGLVISLGFFILWLIAIVNAFNGKKFSIPLIGPIAEKQANS